ncbi:hypothetical protein RND71_034374 [Anisodus tanguticus]|uniref:Methionyl-tRNA synthetase n=1 Tax=Anisodus tanguticus TaxID=243964 RepID=A0AAE1R9J9_9SOLA|nr:hypothetical protein RND71_034374 [Anisodus tanguticus]
MCFGLVCDADERVVQRGRAEGVCPYCGGTIQVVDTQSHWRLCFVPLSSKTKRKYYCSICNRQLVLQ